MPYSGMLLRPAQPEDALAVAGVHVRSWQAAYRNILPDDYLNQLRPEDRAAKYDFATRDPLKPRTIVAVEEGKPSAIYGFATTMPVTDSDMPGYGELCALYVDPQHWGKGLGVALVSAAREQMFEQGFGKAILWVLTGNVRAERFYQNDSWTADGVRRKATVWGIEVDEIRYARQLEPHSPGQARPQRAAGGE
ncbi:MAG TPA: GNAT family N-acetyltransferase [Acidobacteriaceae bacterium]|nr:GNAT family N-acetyltransferase [Acidobacteriaceae bacterium]